MCLHMIDRSVLENVFFLQQDGGMFEDFGV